MVFLVVVVVVTLVVSASCSLAESTLFSTRTAALEAAREAGRHPRAASRFLGLKRDVSRPTAAILILRTPLETGS